MTNSNRLFLINYLKVHRYYAKLERHQAIKERVNRLSFMLHNFFQVEGKEIMITCSFCHTGSPDDSRFCKNCGRPFDQTTATPSSPEFSSATSSSPLQSEAIPKSSQVYQNSVVSQKDKNRPIEYYVDEPAIETHTKIYHDNFLVWEVGIAWYAHEPLSGIQAFRNLGCSNGDTSVGNQCASLSYADCKP